MTSGSAKPTDEPKVSSAGGQTVSARPASRVYNRVMKTVRRVHMYLGLVLFPWVLLYGVSGMLYNHPQLGRDVTGQMLKPDQVQELIGFGAWDPTALAQQVVDSVNQKGANYRLDPETPPDFRGWALLASRAEDGGKHVVIVNLKGGSAIVARHGAPAAAPPPPFFDERLELPGHSTTDLQERFSPLLPKLGVDAAPLRAHPKATPKLKFRMLDAAGTPWNVVYDLGSQTLDGRRADQASPLLFVELLERLHQQHHFPGHFGPTFWWAVFADLTGLTMALWAITGLLMWWQMKRLRIVGAIFVATAVLLASLVMTSTSDELQWNAKPAAGPG